MTKHSTVHTHTYIELTQTETRVIFYVYYVGQVYFMYMTEKNKTLWAHIDDTDAFSSIEQHMQYIKYIIRIISDLAYRISS